MRTTPTVTDEAGAPAPMTWQRAAWYGVGAFVISRLCVLAGAGVRAAQLVVDATEQGQERPKNAVGFITEVLLSWDGRWYLEIVRSGYPHSIPPDITYEQFEARAAFFPVYPAVVRFVDLIAPGGDTFAALFVNLVIAVASVLLVGRLALRLADAEVAARAMVLYAVFPGSFVLSFAYAEATLIALCAACLLLLLDERWLLAGFVGALATATRPNGVAIVAACAVASLLAIRQRRDWLSLAAPLISPIGFIAFQIFLRHHTNESWAWFRVQREAWREGTSFGATAVRNTISFLGDPLASPTDAVTVATMIAMLGALWCAWRRPLPLPVLAFVVVIIALMLLPATVTARPRFLFTAFPLAIPVAAWWPHRDRIGWELMLVACGAGLATLTGLYGVFGAIP
ncbi:MAG: glycosyltransferase family 39 protein [Ilumatobacteraceae bacterium]